MTPYKPWTKWRVSGIFAAERRDLILEAAAHLTQAGRLDGVVYLHAKAAKRPSLFESAFYLEEMSTNRSNKFLRVASIVTPRTLLIFDDVEAIRNYPQSMTRNIINHIAPLARFKLVASGALVTNELANLYAQFAVLDKRVLHANHYWCFAEDHREVSVFGDGAIVSNKDANYLAAKLRPFIYFDLEPENDVQAALYTAVREAPYLDRVHDVEDLRL